MVFTACKKTDSLVSSTLQDASPTEEKFFNSHRTSNAIEKALINYLKKVNEKNSFVEKTVKQIGYPRWDKAITQGKKKNTNNNFAGDSSQTFYIPFVRDSQNYVNASMVMNLTPTDTSFFYRCDWEYRLLQNDGAESLATFFMSLDKVVFNHKKFKIIDSSLFESSHGNALFIRLDTVGSNYTPSNNYWELELMCDWVYTYYVACGFPNSPQCINRCDACYRCIGFYSTRVCWEQWVWNGGSGTPGGNTGGGNPGGGGSTPPPCDVVPIGLMGRVVDPCDQGPGWEPIPADPEIVHIDVISSPHDPEYPDISDNQPQVSLQSLFNCFSQIPDAGATYSVKLSVDLPVNGVWNAPFNLTQKSPGHTFLTLTKTNGSQTISQSVGFYPIGSGGNPLNPIATGGFKNNGDPKHEYNASINASNISTSQFSMVMNNLLSHENDSYNIFYNNCTTIALNAFNLLITPKIAVEPFVVQMPTVPPQAPYYFMQSPQKLYKAIDTFQPGTGLSKEFNVNNDSPLSTITCP